MTTEKKNTTPSANEARYFDELIGQEFAELRTMSLKIRAAAIAASNAADDPSRLDPVSLAEIAADYADALNTQLDEVEKELHEYATLKK